MTVRWKRLLKLSTPLFIGAIGFTTYAYQLPTVRCVIVNDAEKTILKEKGDRCYQLTEGEEAVILTADGVSATSESIELNP